MNNDTISRQAAIDALYHVDEYNGRSIETIKNWQSAQNARNTKSSMKCGTGIPVEKIFSMPMPE